MSEIYWITRLDSVVNWLGTFEGIGLGVGVFALLCGYVWKYIALADYLEEEFEYYKKYFKKIIVAGYIFTSVGLLNGIAKSFVPTTKEMCAIYVGGSVIDYVQGNDTIQALPDKMVNFANEYLNQLIKQNEKE